MHANLIQIISYVTGVIYLLAIATGILIVGSSIKQMDKLKGETHRNMMQAENTPEHAITRAVFGIFLIGSNVIAMYTLASLGATEEYVKDPHAVLGYAAGVSVSSDAKMFALLALTTSRAIGAFALTAGLKHGQHCNHPQEQVRQSARFRFYWSVPCGVVFIYPEFWIDMAAKYYSVAADISNIIHGL